MSLRLLFQRLKVEFSEKLLHISGSNLEPGECGMYIYVIILSISYFVRGEKDIINCNYSKTNFTGSRFEPDMCYTYHILQVLGLSLICSRAFLCALSSSLYIFQSFPWDTIHLSHHNFQEFLLLY
jgi:hypothetical protein